MNCQHVSLPSSESVNYNLMTLLFLIYLLRMFNRKQLENRLFIAENII